MKIMKYLGLCTILIFGACSRGTKVTSTPESTTIEVDESGITDVVDIPWNVGRPERDAQVSKGMRLEIALPDLSESELRLLNERYGMDSWIIKINRVQNGNRQAVGYFYVPLIYQKQGGVSFRSVSSGVIQILYSDAAPSKRFSDFPCPAFGHSLRIGDTTLDTSAQTTLTATKGRKRPLKVRYEKLEFGALGFNGGKTLQGIYWAQIALFSSATGETLSDFSNLGGKLAINSEKSVAINGCGDFAIPRQDEDGNLKEFKFGR